MPTIWCKTWLPNEHTYSKYTEDDELIKKCWFPFTKSEFSQSKIYFNDKSVNKMISNCYEPNEIDGIWFNVKIVAGPFGMYI